MKREQNRKIPLGLIWFVVTLLIVAGAVFGYSYRINQVKKHFDHQVYAEEPDSREQDKYRLFLTDLGVDLSVPGTGGVTLTFTSPKNFEMWERFNRGHQVGQGETLRCDFVSWSTGSRCLMIEYDGKLRQCSVPYKLAAQLYAAALEQNGLEEQFLADTGEELSYRSARRALRTIDAQIYDKGVFIPGDYPFDQSAWERMMLLVGGSLPLILLALLTIVPALVEYAQYQLWLADYNKENSRRWKNIEGSLPQFVSLQENSGGGKPQPVYQPPSLGQRIKKLFSPVSR